MPELAVKKRGLRADAQRNYDRIVEVAAEAFAEHGVQASLDSIALKAEVGPGTLYRHFPTRDDLLVAAVGEGWAKTVQHGKALADSTDSVEALREWMLTLSGHLGTWGGLPECVGRALGSDTSPFVPTCGNAREVTGGILSRAQKEGRIREDVAADDLIVLASALAWAVDDNGAAPADLPRLLDLVVSGLTVRAEA